MKWCTCKLGSCRSRWWPSFYGIHRCRTWNGAKQLGDLAGRSCSAASESWPNGLPCFSFDWFSLTRFICYAFRVLGFRGKRQDRFKEGRTERKRIEMKSQEPLPTPDARWIDSFVPFASSISAFFLEWWDCVNYCLGFVRGRGGRIWNWMGN